MKVSNSGPLIHLARIQKLKIITDTVKEEVVEAGKNKGYADAIIIENAINEGWIKVVKVEKNLVKDYTKLGLHKAEADAISIALQNKAEIFLDEDTARKFATLLKLKVRGSIGIIIDALKKGIITKKQALNALDDLANTMYLRVKVYMYARKIIEESVPKSDKEAQ